MFKDKWMDVLFVFRNNNGSINTFTNKRHLCASTIFAADITILSGAGAERVCFAWLTGRHCPRRVRWNLTRTFASGSIFFGHLS